MTQLIQFQPDPLHPESLVHFGTDYALKHLVPSYHSFGWTAEDGSHMAFEARVRYSNHCFSEEIGQGVPQTGACALADGNKIRVFCPVRHGHSMTLPEIMTGLFAKVTTPVCLTHENNWTVFRLQMTPALDKGEKYFVFFKVRQANPGVLTPGQPHRLDIYVQSAYGRAAPVETFRRYPFGRVAERVALGIRV
jgi:hypothetical protein